MLRFNQTPLQYSHCKYNFILYLKFIEVTVKEFLKFVLFSSDPQKKRFFWERLGFFENVIKKSDKKTIWFHANSIGEVNALVQIVGFFRVKFKNVHILITTTNFCGDDRARKLRIADTVIFFPQDVPLIITKFLKAFKPVYVIIVECDIWPNFVRLCNKNRIPVIVISGIYTDALIRSLGIRYFYDYKFRLSADILKDINIYCMQNEEYAGELVRLLPQHHRISVTGNLKFSASFPKEPEANKNRDYLTLFGIRNFEYVVVFGNIHKEEVGELLSVFKSLKNKFNNLVAVLALRFMEDLQYARSFLESNKIDYIIRTDLDKKQRTGEALILLDTMGELPYVYGIGKIAFVGGSLIPLGDRVGGHNILEPAIQGAAVFFGQYMEHFKSLARLFYERKAGIMVRDSADLLARIEQFIRQPQELQLVVSNANQVIGENMDVAEKTFMRIESELSSA